MTREPGDDRHLIVERLDETMIVEAAAGTGKTTALVGRIVRLVETRRARIGEIAAVTFSEKAAGELKLRLREELERARGRHAHDAPESALLARAVHDFEDAHVSTIHGFCAELLRERPVEARIDPAFTVLTQSQADAVFDEAFAAWLQAQLAHPGEGVRRSLRRPSPWRPDAQDENGPIERLRRAARDLREWRDHEAAWTRPEYDRRHAVTALIDELRAFAEMTATPLKKGDLFSVDTAPARRTSADIERLRRIGSDGDDVWDGWEAALVALADHRDFGRARRGSGAAFAQGVSRQAAHDAHAQLLANLARFKRNADADMAALLREEIRGCLALYEARKHAAGSLDFLDLLIKARDLVRDSAPVRKRFRNRFRVLLVDEFQDTDPLQAELLLLLAGEDGGPRLRKGALFIVGDPKQSIYRFRRADVGAYRRLSDELSRQDATPVMLQTSFRSVPGIQRFVNAAFSAEMTGDERSMQASYVALKPSRADHAAQPAVVALPVPRPYGKTQVTLQALADSQPGAIGEFVAWLVSDKCPWTVEGRRIVPSDVCLLFRRFLHYGDDVTRDYVEALEARGVPHLLVGGKTFYEREEVDAIRSALTAIEWPEDELSVYATLHGPLFALGEEELLEYHAHAHVFHPYRVPGDLPERLAGVASALATLRELHAVRNHRPVADTIGRLIAATRAHAGFILWRGGEQVLANVMHISDLARRYEGEGGLSFRGFVDVLREAAGRAEAPEAPILEEGSEGVRLMTVHKAKGLEFPVVILADMGCRLSMDDASRHLDSSRNLCALRIGGWAPLDLLEHNDLEAARDEAEGVRLAYVAATRARDLLVVPAVGDGPYQKGWVRPLNRALYPPVAQRQSPMTAAHCPAFAGKDTLLDRPDGQQPDASTVRPGAYEMTDPESGEPYTVVWWDPKLLDGRADDGRGLRREELISKEAAPADVAADRARYDQWRASREAVRQAGARPSVTMLTATEWAKGSTEGRAVHVEGRAGHMAGRVGHMEGRGFSPGQIKVEDASTPSPRPSGRRFGVLVHALLAAIPLDAGAKEVRDLAEVHARILGATDEERAAAASTVDRVLRHPVLLAAQDAARAGRACRREAPVSIVIDAPHAPVLVDGQADLAYEAADGWVVVDFKTDVELSGAEDTYRRQVALYVDAVAKATGTPASGLLLKI